MKIKLYFAQQNVTYNRCVLIYLVYYEQHFTVRYKIEQSLRINS